MKPVASHIIYENPLPQLRALGSAFPYLCELPGGKILASTDVISFRESYRLVSGDREHLEVRRPKLIGCKEHAFGFTGLIRAEDEGAFAACKIAPADLESIMIYTEQEDSHEAASL